MTSEDPARPLILTNSNLSPRILDKTQENLMIRFIPIFFSIFLFGCQDNKHIEAYVRQTNTLGNNEAAFKNHVSQVATQINAAGMSEVTAGKILLAASSCKLETVAAQVEFAKVVIMITSIDKQVGSEEKYAALVCEAISGLNKDWLNAPAQITDLSNMSAKAVSSGSLKTHHDFYSAIKQWNSILNEETKKSFTPNGIGLFIVSVSVLDGKATDFIKNYYQDPQLQATMNKHGFAKVIGGNTGFDVQRFQKIAATLLK